MDLNTKKINSIKKKAFEKVVPKKSAEKLVSQILKEFIEKLRKVSGKKIKFLVGGSFAKKTTIKKDKYDVDLFSLFNKSEKNISEKLKKILKKAKVKFLVLHGSRDYFSVKVKEKDVLVYFEIIPVLKIKNSKEAENITDVSPLHVKYVKEKISGKKRFNDEIRLTKAFCYAQNCYGAESYIGGFSGYSLELLTIYYGSFLNFIKKVSKWSKREIIDPEKRFKKKSEVLERLDNSKLLSPLILVDPVQFNRNATAALSREKYSLLKEACKNFLKNPSLKFFKKKEISVKEMLRKTKLKKGSLGILKILSIKKKEDVCYAKESKFADFFIFKLNKNGFDVLKTKKEFLEKETILYFIYKKPKKEFLVSGPPLEMKKNVVAFKKKHKGDNFLQKHGKIYVKVNREILNLEDFLFVFKRKEAKIMKEMAIKNINLVRVK